ncbi:hypothetical protein PMI05_04780 [Brevibacillus sp. BC25]|nr:hypothetical protein PMI05_04780 [Brevibacillus sp. BC25]
MGVIDPNQMLPAQRHFVENVLNLLGVHGESDRAFQYIFHTPNRLCTPISTGKQSARFIWLLLQGISEDFIPDCTGHGKGGL